MPRPSQEKAMKKTQFPAQWDEERVQRVLVHYETQAEEEAVAEDEAAYKAMTPSVKKLRLPEK
jgi:hypothetical protein